MTVLNFVVCLSVGLPFCALSLYNQATDMINNTNQISRLLTVAKVAQKRIRALSPQQKTQLEKMWDVEHAYYSSALEGGKLDKQEFEKLAEEIP